MYLTNEQVQELQDTGIDEKIEKFAELFPNGTETYDLCIKHPDVFSFGLPGARLMPHCGWKAYWDKVFKAKDDYRWRMMRPNWWLWNATRDLEQERIGLERLLAKRKKENPNYNHDAPPRIFSIVTMPLPPPPDIPKQQMLDKYNVEKEHVTRERDLALALIFYEASLI